MTKYPSLAFKSIFALILLASSVCSASTFSSASQTLYQLFRRPSCEARLGAGSRDARIPLAPETERSLEGLEHLAETYLPLHYSRVYSQQIRLALEHPSALPEEVLNWIDASAFLPDVMWMNEKAREFRENLIAKSPGNSFRREDPVLLQLNHLDELVSWTQGVLDKNRLTYLEFLELSDAWIFSLRSRPNPEIAISRPGILALRDPEAAFPFDLQAPIHQDLSVWDLILMGPFEIHPRGLVYPQTSADGVTFPLDGFYAHDGLHGIDKRRDLEKTLPEGSKRDLQTRLQALRERVALLERFLKSLEALDAKSAKLREVVWFVLDHESGYIYSREYWVLRGVPQPFFLAAEPIAETILRRMEDSRDLAPHLTPFQAKDFTIEEIVAELRAIYELGRSP